MNIDPSEEKIKSFLESNSLGRNRFLNSLLSIIQTSPDNVIINLNGNWGSGKTVIAKEIQMIQAGATAKDIDEEIAQDIRTDYAVFYYNAWENDQYDPAESILFQLISAYWKGSEKLANEVLATAKSFVSKTIETVSFGLICPDDVQTKDKTKDWIAELKETNQKKEAASNIIANTLDNTKKKHLLFIIDELDRCNPAFAIKLIEVIKHYFSGERVKVLFLTNNQQLSSIIENNYGEKFSGYEYLNKIFDLIIDIPIVDRRTFISSHNLENADFDAITAIADYYSMSLREIERFIILYQVSSQYLNSHILRDVASRPTPLKYFTKHLLLPMILGAKIKNQNDYTALIALNERGRDVMQNIASTSYGTDIMRSCHSPTAPISIDTLYNELKFHNDRSSTYNTNPQAIYQLISEMVSVIGIIPANINNSTQGEENV